MKYYKIQRWETPISDIYLLDIYFHSSSYNANKELFFRLIDFNTQLIYEFIFKKPGPYFQVPENLVGLQHLGEGPERLTIGLTYIIDDDDIVKLMNESTFYGLYHSSLLDAWRYKRYFIFNCDICLDIITTEEPKIIIYSVAEFNEKNKLP